MSLGTHFPLFFTDEAQFMFAGYTNETKTTEYGALKIPYLQGKNVTAGSSVMGPTLLLWIHTAVSLITIM